MIIIKVLEAAQESKFLDGGQGTTAGRSAGQPEHYRRIPRSWTRRQRNISRQSTWPFHVHQSDRPQSCRGRIVAVGSWLLRWVSCKLGISPPISMLDDVKTAVLTSGSGNIHSSGLTLCGKQFRRKRTRTIVRKTVSRNPWIGGWSFFSWQRKWQPICLHIVSITVNFCLMLWRVFQTASACRGQNLCPPNVKDVWFGSN